MRLALPGLRFLLSEGDNRVGSLSAFLPSDVPFVQERLDESQKFLGLGRFDIDYKVHVFFHMGTYVPYLPHSVDGFPCSRVNPGLQGLDSRIPTTVWASVGQACHAWHRITATESRLVNLCGAFD